MAPAVRLNEIVKSFDGAKALDGAPARSTMGSGARTSR